MFIAEVFIDDKGTVSFDSQFTSVHHTEGQYEVYSHDMIVLKKLNIKEHKMFRKYYGYKMKMLGYNYTVYFPNEDVVEIDYDPPVPCEVILNL